MFTKIKNGFTNILTPNKWNTKNRELETTAADQLNMELMVQRSSMNLMR